MVSAPPRFPNGLSLRSSLRSSFFPLAEQVFERAFRFSHWLHPGAGTDGGGRPVLASRFAVAIYELNRVLGGEGLTVLGHFKTGADYSHSAHVTVQEAYGQVSYVGTG